jgi:hypothetical protein
MDSNSDDVTEDGREEEWVQCDSNSDSMIRNGLGDNSFNLWPDGTIPYKITEGFNSTGLANIREAVKSYNEIFNGCLRWIERTSEASATACVR